MATVGQIIYNLHDFNGSGGIISTASKYGNGTTTSQEDRFNIYIDIVSQIIEGGRFKKLGIQAPPGTKFMLNGRVIMMGRTGVYELDEDIEVESLYFDRRPNYQINQGQSNANKSNGINQMNQAKTDLKNSIDALNTRYANANQKPDDAYWLEYNGYQQTYITKYNEAFALYLSGLNGVYEQPSEDEGNQYLEIYDVIIDFMY